MARRLVLLPQGMPMAPDEASNCVDIIRRCGGDLSRIIDAPTATLELFSRHISRLKALDGRIAPIVLLTQTCPLTLAVIAARRTLEKHSPMLHQAAWVILHDPMRDPFFEGEAVTLGTFDLPVRDAPIWSSPGGLHYLVVVPGGTANLEGRVEELMSRASLPPDRDSDELQW